jgi:glycosyltransferase involved in cell wall biosynthesis
MAQASRPTERIAVLIPAFRPDESLAQLVSSLLALSFGAIVVVNDGSGAGYDPIFEQLGQAPRVRVLRHPVNLGKGRALKTGLRYFLDHLTDFDGVVTCDADGQHDAADVWTTAQRVYGAPEKLVMGVRRFRGSIPLRSRLGNAITKHVFAFLTGSTLGDTQCGLRGIPRKLIPRCLHLAGDRYEFEMNVLADAARSCGVAEVPIDTIYINGNRSSHFRPFWDSMQIYLVLARFYLSSLIAASLDLAIFAVVFWSTNICGRISSIANLFYNRPGFPSWTRE